MSQMSFPVAETLTLIVGLVVVHGIMTACTTPREPDPDPGPWPEMEEPESVPIRTNDQAEIEEPVPADPYVVELFDSGRYMVIGREEWLPAQKFIECYANGSRCAVFGQRYGRPTWVSPYKKKGIQWLRFKAGNLEETFYVGDEEDE